MFDHDHWMRQALLLAARAASEEEVPVGALVVHDDRIIGKGYNQVECLKDATAHAEMIALTSASNHLDNRILGACTLYVTKEPCLMCAGAALLTRIPRVVFGAFDAREGAAGSRYDVMRDSPKPCVEIIGGIRREEAETLLSSFFQTLRQRPPRQNGNGQPPGSPS